MERIEELNHTIASHSRSLKLIRSLMSFEVTLHHLNDKLGLHNIAKSKHMLQILKENLCLAMKIYNGASSEATQVLNT